MASKAARLANLRAKLTQVAADLDGMTRDLAGSPWHNYRITQAWNLVAEIERLVEDVEAGPVVRARACGICGATTVSLAPICEPCRQVYDKPAASKANRRKSLAVSVVTSA